MLKWKFDKVSFATCGLFESRFQSGCTRIVNSSSLIRVQRRLAASIQTEAIYKLQANSNRPWKLSPGLNAAKLSSLWEIRCPEEA